LAMMHVNIELLNQLKLTIPYTMSTLSKLFYWEKKNPNEESSFIIKIIIFFRKM
jgi:hypothetical protein